MRFDTLLLLQKREQQLHGLAVGCAFVQLDLLVIIPFKKSHQLLVTETLFDKVEPGIIVSDSTVTGKAFQYDMECVASV